MVETDFLIKQELNIPDKGKLAWQAPSNIALIKYWGKHQNQIPANPSISFTLDNCHTQTAVSFEKKERKEGYSFELLFEGEPKPSFKPKIETFFNRIETYLPFLKDYHFVIETSNSFPHSSGIASSASGMAALALCLVEIEGLGTNLSDSYFYQKASFLARLGSGSACRSVQGDLVQWGSHKGISDSSDLYGIPYPFQVAPVFKTYQDTILLVHKGQKTVSSTVGHQLMNGHPFAEKRFEQAHSNLEAIQAIFEQGDLDKFIALVESEALTLHAMMMTSMPYFVLMKPETLAIIEKIWEFRKQTGLHACFTLDAGANVHLLYPEEEKQTTLQFIENELASLCENGHYICDSVGQGAKRLIIS